MASTQDARSCFSLFYLSSNLLANLLSKHWGLAHHVSSLLHFLSTLWVLGLAIQWGHEDGILNEFYWHSASGKRLKTAQDFFSLASNTELMFILALLLGPLAYIIHSLLKTRSRSADPPVIWDLLNPEYSCIIVVAQYLSFLLILDGSLRAELFWRVCGFTSAAAFCTDKERLNRYRSLVHSTSAMIYGKVNLLIHEWPWLAATIADERRPESVRLDVAWTLFNVAICCLGRFAS